MKLPEYDNRPKPGEPLYRTPNESSEWDDIKFTVLGIGLPLLLLVGVGATIAQLFELIRSLFR